MSDNAYLDILARMEAKLDSLVAIVVPPARGGVAGGGSAVADPFAPGQAATTFQEAHDNAFLRSGRDVLGYRHREDAALAVCMEELKKANLLPGDTAPVTGRFATWASAKESGELRGAVIRYALLTGLVETEAELLVPSFTPHANGDTVVNGVAPPRTMDSEQFWWTTLEPMIRYASGPGGPGASGGDAGRGDATPAGAGGHK